MHRQLIRSKKSSPQESNILEEDKKNERPSQVRFSTLQQIFFSPLALLDQLTEQKNISISPAAESQRLSQEREGILHHPSSEFKSKYNEHLTYSRENCLITYFIKNSFSGMAPGHVLLAIEGRDIVDSENSPGDLIAFDFVSQDFAIDLARSNRQTEVKLVAALRTLESEVIERKESRDLQEIVTTLLVAINAGVRVAARGGSRFEIVCECFKTLALRSKTVQSIANDVLIRSINSSSTGVRGIIGTSGVIRSSHPLSAERDSVKIKCWECMSGLDDSFHTFKISRQEANDLIARIRSEERAPRPFKLLGRQLSLWKGINCMDWVLEHITSIPSCKRIAQDAWGKSGLLVSSRGLTTPASLLEALKRAERSQNIRLS